MKKFDVQKRVVAALLASFACVATMIIQIPNGIGGYFNLGDCIVLLCGWLLGPVYGFLAGGLGSAIADLIGYPAYAVATFFIKGTQALVAWLLFRLLIKPIGEKRKLAAYLVSGIGAQLIMVGGYYIFEGFYYNSFVSVLANVPFNLIQSVAGIVVGIIVITAINKTRIKNMLGSGK